MGHNESTCPPSPLLWLGLRETGISWCAQRSHPWESTEKPLVQGADTPICRLHYLLTCISRKGRQRDSLAGLPSNFLAENRLCGLSAQGRTFSLFLRKIKIEDVIREGYTGNIIKQEWVLKSPSYALLQLQQKGKRKEGFVCLLESGPQIIRRVFKKVSLVLLCSVWNRTQIKSNILKEANWGLGLPPTGNGADLHGKYPEGRKKTQHCRALALFVGR